jgi:D-3-phosphoglycerate dehydrogenase
MRVLFIDTIHPYLWDTLTSDGNECVDVTSLSKQQVMDQLSGVHGLVIRSRFLLDKEFLDKAVDLRFIARSGAGMENIDVAYATTKGIHCLNSPEGNRDAVAEHALGMLLMLFNNLSRTDREVRNGLWSRELNRGVELSGKTVGIIGYGNMGAAFAKRLTGFDCEVLAYDPYLEKLPNNFAKKVELEELFSKADVVSLHSPLTDETEYLVDLKFLQSFEKSIWLINTARGKCLRIADLVSALKSGKVRGACLDVLEFEDLSFEKFDIRNSTFSESDDWKYLIKSDKVVFSPHIAGWTTESHLKLSSVLYEKIKQSCPE